MASRRTSIVFAAVFGLVASLVSISPAQAIDTATVEGVVTAPGGGLPDTPVEVVLSQSSALNPATDFSTTTDPSTGQYSMDAPAGTYYLRYFYLGEANILPWIWNTGWVEGGFLPNKVSLTVGAPLVIDRELIPGASIAGTAVGLGGVLLESFAVTAQKVPGGTYGRASVDVANGSYIVDRLPRGDFKVQFTSSPKWKTSWIGPPEISLVAGQAVTGADVVLSHATTIEGHITYRTAATVPYPEHVFIQLRDPTTGSLSAYTYTDADGAYHLYGVVPGTYQVCAYPWGSQTVFGNCWGDASEGTAPTLTVANGQVLSDIDFPVDPAGSIQGRILARPTPFDTASPLSSGRVTLYRLDGDSYVMEKSTSTQLDGTFVVGPLTPGQYAVRFSDDDSTFNAEYWDDVRYFWASTDIEVGAGSAVHLPDVTLDTRSFEVSRIAGANRFEGGVEVSRVIYPDDSVPSEGVPVVYIANGLDFPDALAAGPAAAVQDGVVLLVTPSSIPSKVAAELTRLHPQRIVVAGGSAVVSPAVFAQLQTYTPSPADVYRAGGTNRYDTARKIVSDAFGVDGADMAIIAAGGSFPDALAAGPAAASQSAPVILVDGAGSSIDSATRKLIQELGIQRIYIAGGTGVLGPGIEASLKVLLGDGNVIRLAGSNRFNTAVLISQEFFPASEYAYLATGYNFPDALTGGPLAAAFGGPLYLTKTQCLLPEVADDIRDLDAQAIVLLGGKAVLTPAVEQLELCS